MLGYSVKVLRIYVSSCQVASVFGRIFLSLGSWQDLSRHIYIYIWTSIFTELASRRLDFFQRRQSHQGYCTGTRQVVLGRNIQYFVCPVKVNMYHVPLPYASKVHIISFPRIMQLITHAHTHTKKYRKTENSYESLLNYFTLDTWSLPWEKSWLPRLPKLEPALWQKNIKTSELA